MKIVKVSPKGQITIPKMCRDSVVCQHYLFQIQDNIIMLKPLEIKVGSKRKVKKNELAKFGYLSEKSFDFWNDPADDVYQNFYK